MRAAFLVFYRRMLICINGTLGAGKGTVVEFLKQKGFTHYSVRDFLALELHKRRLDKNRDNMLAVANDLRTINGPGYIAEQLTELANAAGGNAVIESIRSVGEADYLKAHGAQLWAVDADEALRYERITKRASETDEVSFEKFKEDEAAEFANTDPTKPNLKKLIESADAVFQNNGTPEELCAQVEQALLKGA
jgi:dephospho-CoA kinase